MVSVSLAEILTIALIVVIVFGPKRLPEISRRAGRLLRELKAAAAELRAGLEAEATRAESALDGLRRDLGPTITEGPEAPYGEEAE